MPLAKYLILALLATNIYLGSCAQAPVAAFTTNVQSGCSPLIVNFANQSLNNPTKCLWYFGDGNKSTQLNPIYVYETPGQYTVKLVVFNASGADSVVRVNYITVEGVSSLNFSAADTVVCFPGSVNFTAAIVPATASLTYLWDFGNGFTSTLAAPTSFYNFLDTFSVFLKVTSPTGCVSSLLKPNYIRSKPKPITNFSVVNNNCAAPSLVNFNNLSTSNGAGSLTYNWAFGNGGASTNTAPSSNYTANGNYNVTLNTTAINGCTSSKTITNAVVLSPSGTTINSLDSVCAFTNFTASFNTAIIAPYTILWQINNLPYTINNLFNYTFSTAGNYNIKLIIYYGNCSDTVIKTIKVNPVPDVVDFIADTTRLCKNPGNVIFTNLSSDLSNSFTWSFGNGNSSTLINPTQTYIEFTGNLPDRTPFNVRLKSTNILGCSKEVTKFNYIIMRLPTADPFSKGGCDPYLMNTFTTFFNITPLINIVWNYGDGSPLQTNLTNTVVHNYATVGDYTPTITYNFINGCTLTQNGLVRVTSKPTANFTAVSTSECKSSKFQFINQSVNATTYLWNFYKPLYTESSNIENPLMLFSDTGNLTVRLIAANILCRDTIIKNNFIFVKPPVAKFIFDFSCPNRLERKFRALPFTGGATSYLWNLSDGTTSTLPNFTTTLNNGGNLTYTLIVNNNVYNCSDTMVKNETIRTDFAVTADKTEICKGETVTFNTNFSNGFYGLDMFSNTFFVDFGNGIFTLVNFNNPISFTYNEVGNYTVKFVFRNRQLACRDTVINVDFIKVYGPKANINGVATSTNPCSSLRFTINNLSTSYGGFALVNYIINWGDGFIDNSPTPNYTHTYATPGNYFASVTVVDARGCTDVANILFTATKSVIQSSFYTPINSSCVNGSPIQFINTSFGNSLLYLWSFGDGTTSMAQNPLHTYTTAGSFNVSLIITNNFNCKDTFLINNAVTIGVPVARFNLSDSFSFCNPALINFTNASTYATAFNYTFGDGSQAIIPNPQKVYNNYGNYVVKLVVTSVGGCKDSTSKNIILANPNIQIVLGAKQGCMPFKFSFNNTSNGGDSYVWIFGDGFSAYNLGGNATHIYDTPGVYLPKVYIIDNGGCYIKQQITDSIKVYGTIFDFAKTAPPLCDTATIKFTPNITANYTGVQSYNWRFSNGVTSNLQSPNVLFNYGVFNAQLIVKTPEGCADTLTKNNFIKINYLPKFKIIGPDTICRNSLGNYAATILNPIINPAIKYSWQNSFGEVSANTLFTTKNNLLGSFIVTLKITDTINGCNTTDSVKVLNAGTDFDFTKTQNNQCDTATVPFNYIENLSEPALKKLAWNFNNGSTSNLNNPSSFFNAGNYNIQLTATTTTNCIDVVTKNNFVAIGLTPKPKINLADSFCLGEIGNLNATILNAPFSNIKYTWKINNDTLPQNILNNKTLFTSLGIKQVQLFATNTSFNCVGVDSATTIIKPCNIDIFVPNAFAPNGVNKIIFPTPARGVKLIKFEIFNRWGGVVYTQNNFGVGLGWGGNINGVPQATQTFVYKVSGYIYDGSVIYRSGTITLIR